MQFVEFRVAEDEAVVGVPEHEGFRDRLDGVVQARVGSRSSLLQTALLGHVDGDADEMASSVVRIIHQLGAGAQPDPFAGGAADAEFVVEQRGPGGSKLFRQRVEILVVRMNHGVDLAERQELVLTLVTEKFVHGIRPIEPATSDIPVPQAAAAAIESGIDPIADLLTDLIGRSRAIGLHYIRDADAEQHHDGGAEQGDMSDGARPPAGEHTRQRLYECDLSGRCGQRAHRRNAIDAACQLDGHHAGAVGECGKRLRFTQEVDEGCGNRHGGRMNRQHFAGCVDEDEGAALGERGGRHAAHDRVELGRRRVAVGRRMMNAKLGSRQRGDDVDIRNRVRERAFPPFANLNPGARCERQEKQRQDRRNGEPQQGFVLFETPIGRVRVRSRYPQNRTRACGNARGSCPRHA